MNIYKFKTWLIVYLTLIHINEFIQSTLILAYGGSNYGGAISYKKHTGYGFNKAGFTYVSGRNDWLGSEYGDFGSNLHFVTVNIHHTFNTSKIKFKRDIYENVDTFFVRYPYLIYKVMNGRQLVWESDGYRYAENVVVRYDHRGKPRVRVNFIMDEDDRDAFRHPNPKLIVVNMDLKYSTDKVVYDFDYRSNAEVFTAVEPYYIWKIVKDCRVVWKHERGHYPYQVLYRRHRSRRSKLRLFYPDHQPEHAHFKPGYNKAHHYQPIYEPDKPWFSRRCDLINVSKLDIHEYPEDVKLYFQGSPFANDINKFKVYMVGDEDELYMFKINQGAKCTEVKYGHKIPARHQSGGTGRQFRKVWSVDDHFVGYPKAVYTHGSIKFLFIEFSNDSFRFYRKTTNNINWLWIPLRNVSHLDVSKIKVLTNEFIFNRTLKDLDRRLYSIYDLGFAYQLIFKHTAKCKQLKYDNRILYTHNSDHDRGNYPSSIYLMSNGACEVVYSNTAFFIEPDYGTLSMNHT